MAQLSLFQKTPLFPSDVLERFRNEHRNEPIPGQEGIISWLDSWLNESVRQRRTESELEQAFNQNFWGEEILGYKIGPLGAEWTAWPKPSRRETKLDGTPDLILGHFQSNNERFSPIAIVELKPPGTSLDAPQPSYDNKSPVEQAFEYAENLPPTRWVIVSDMVMVRLYGIDDQKRFHVFNLANCVNFQAKQLTDEFRDLYFLLRKTSLIDGETDSGTSRLVRASGEEQLLFQEGFYDVYSQIRLDLLDAISDWLKEHGNQYSKKEIIEAAQRLLDRMIFIHFCEDHPDRLLPHNLVKNMIESALYHIPGPSPHKVYSNLKQLFKDIDVGVTAGDWRIPQYNGELFKYHPIVDEVEIPDSLAVKTYAPSNGLNSRTVRGVWGLDVFDFWRELDRDLLGNIFERSIADLAEISEDAEQITIADTLKEQKEWGIFFTSRLLARFLAQSVIEKCIEENENIQSMLTSIQQVESDKDFEIAIGKLLNEVKKLKILDPACGSGIFLTAALDNLLKPYLKALEVRRRDLILAWESIKSNLYQQSAITKSSVFGVDLLPQAAELAKLALWLTAARKDEISSDLSSNILAGDSLSPSLLQNLKNMVPEGFDAILGNPPWGGRYNPEFAIQVIEQAGLNVTAHWDSWEIFTILAWHLLKDRGRLGLILPDTIHSPEKEKIRDFLIHNFKIEKLYNMGPDWFGSRVRMGSIVLQAIKGSSNDSHLMKGLVLSGDLRRKAIKGIVPLRQIESSLSHSLLQKRAGESLTNEIRVFCSEYDYQLMEKMDLHSTPLVELTERARGEEMNAEGYFWRCPNCNGYTVPGEKKKGGGYDSKNCPFCGLELKDSNTSGLFVVSDSSPSGSREPYIDGKVLNHRYEKLQSKSIDTNFSPTDPSFKDRNIYRPPKIVIRQAGVGITASMSYDWARCPQSIYLYRCSQESLNSGYTEEFILAALVSRTMNFYLLKRFGEVDPAKAHIKLTHARLEDLPIPRLGNPETLQIASQITTDVREMLQGANLGSDIDHRIELNLRKLWEISPEAGAYINGTFSLIPESQTVKDLFPSGPPQLMNI